MAKKMWFVFDATNEFILSGYKLKSEALQRAERVIKKLGNSKDNKTKIVVLSRNDLRIQKYAKTHLYGAERNNFNKNHELILSTEGQYKLGGAEIV